MGFSLSSFVDVFARRSFSAAGLRPHSFDLDSDTTIHCWLSKSLSPQNPNPNPNPKKPPLLLIHGFGPAATWQWRPQVPALSRHFDLIVPDLIFFGRSTTRATDRSEAFQAACLDRLLGRIGVEGPVSVVGTSYGGFVAYHVARMCGAGRVSRVVIASSDVLKREEDDVALRERAGGVERVSDLMLPRSTAHLRTLLRLALYRQPRFMPEFLLRDVVRNLYRDKLEEKMELIKGITLGNKDEFQITPLSQEVLILWGEHDQIFPLEKAYELKKVLGEKARLEIMKNTGHMPQVEDPIKFNEVLINFLLDSPTSSL